MSVADTISRPYARAIFEIAIENNSIEQWEEMLIFINMISCSKKIKNFLSGALSPKYLSSIFIIIGKDIINEHGKNLIKLLAENHRFIILNNILEQFLKLKAYYKKIVIVELRTAFLLKDEQVIKIRKILEKSLLKKIKFVYKIDNHILNGVILKINNTVLDLSVRNHLKQLSDSLKF